MRSWPLSSFPPRQEGSYGLSISSKCDDCGQDATLWVEEKIALPMWELSTLYSKRYRKLCEPCYTLRVLGEHA